MHKIPLTALEQEGLGKHGLKIGEPSQLSGCFRHGVAWALRAQDSELAALRTKLEEAEQGNVCPDCHNAFLQPFKCVTCGAQKLYDATLLTAQKRAEEAERKLADKDRDRHYHMDAINRLASFLALSGTSFEVVQAAIDNMTRMASELSALRTKLEGYLERTHRAEAGAINMGHELAHMTTRAEEAERKSPI